MLGVVLLLAVYVSLLLTAYVVSLLTAYVVLLLTAYVVLLVTAYVVLLVTEYVVLLLTEYVSLLLTAYERVLCLFSDLYFKFRVQVWNRENASINNISCCDPILVSLVLLSLDRCRTGSLTQRAGTGEVLYVTFQVQCTFL